MTTAEQFRPRGRESEIIDAAMSELARGGIGGVTMRAVASAAGVSLGLANYYFTDKTTLVCAVLRRIGELDRAIVDDDHGLDPVTRLRRALRRVVRPEYLQADYLALRLQLWSLASVNPAFGDINRAAQHAYLDGLTELIVGAVPEVNRTEAHRRAAEVLVVQNGIWLTAAIVRQPGAIARCVERCEEIALGTKINA